MLFSPSPCPVSLAKNTPMTCYHVEDDHFSAPEHGSIVPYKLDHSVVKDKKITEGFFQALESLTTFYTEISQRLDFETVSAATLEAFRKHLSDRVQALGLDAKKKAEVLHFCHGKLAITTDPNAP